MQSMRVFFLSYPSARRSTALGSAILAGSAIKLFGWDIEKPETLSKVNTRGSRTFESRFTENVREEKWVGWKRAVERSRNWDVSPEE